MQRDVDWCNRHFDSLNLISTESLGIFLPFSGQPYDLSDELVVTIQNWGDHRTQYLITVTECPVHVDPVPPQLSNLAIFETSVHTFEINSDTGLQPGDSCLVTLTGPTGRIYDERLAIVP